MSEEDRHLILQMNAVFFFSALRMYMDTKQYVSSVSEMNGINRTLRVYVGSLTSLYARGYPSTWCSAGKALHKHVASSGPALNGSDDGKSTSGDGS